MCVVTDAGVSKLEAWKIARAATSGVGRAVVPSATAVDGDLVAAWPGGEADANPFVLEAVAAEAGGGGNPRRRRPARVLQAVLRPATAGPEQ